MDLTGTTLGRRYRLVRTLGAGAVGAVYEGVETSSGRRFAIKLLQTVTPSESELERFRREAHALAALGNVHIVQLLDFRADPGEPPYLVMELLEGESLGSLLARLGTLRADRVVEYALQALDALGAAHAAGLVHRDIKIDNLFLATSRGGAREVLKVVDFGVAKLGRPDLGTLTAEGAVVGTLGYLSPEQASGRPVDGRADVYALGVCMYVALSGKMPVVETNYFSTLKRIVHGEVTPLAQVAPEVDARLCALVHKALARDRNERFPSASAMRDALTRYLRGATEEPTVAAAAPDPTAPAVASLPPKPVLSALQTLPCAPHCWWRSPAWPSSCGACSGIVRCVMSPRSSRAAPRRHRWWPRRRQLRPAAQSPMARWCPDRQSGASRSRGHLRRHRTPAARAPRC